MQQLLNNEYFQFLNRFYPEAPTRTVIQFMKLCKNSQFSIINDTTITSCLTGMKIEKIGTRKYKHYGLYGEYVQSLPKLFD